jgi:hypothetical protein
VLIFCRFGSDLYRIQLPHHKFQSCLQRPRCNLLWPANLRHWDSVRQRLCHTFPKINYWLNPQTLTLNNWYNLFAFTLEQTIWIISLSEVNAFLQFEQSFSPTNDKNPLETLTNAQRTMIVEVFITLNWLDDTEHRQV